MFKVYRDAMKDEIWWKQRENECELYSQFFGVIYHTGEIFKIKKEAQCSVTSIFDLISLEILQRADLVIDLEDGLIIKNRFGGMRYNDLHIALSARKWPTKYDTSNLK